MRTRVILLVVAVVIGVAIAYVDSRPSWDDTAITVGSLVLSTGLLAFFSPKQPWIWALAVGIWIPLFAVAGAHNYGGVIALVFAFVGAYGGMLLRRVTGTAK